MIKNILKLLDNIKDEITVARNKAVISANEHMIKVYYNIDKKLIENNKWASKFIDMLAKDLKISFPKKKGLSATNLGYMQKFANVYNEDEIFQQGVGKLSWCSNIMLMDKLKTNEERLWYVNSAFN